MEGSFELSFALVVPKLLAKRTKDALEAHGRLDKNNKIKAFSVLSRYESIDGVLENVQEGAVLLPLTRKCEDDRHGSELLSKFIDFLGMGEHIANICLVRMLLPAGAQGNHHGMNPLASTIARWIHQTTQWSGADRSTCSTSKLLASYNWSYMVYQPLLLLASSSLSKLSSVLAIVDLPDGFSSLYALLCESFKITHIALNAPVPGNIPAKPTTADLYNQEEYQQLREDECDHSLNILRSPTGLTPLYGDFGPNLAPDHTPTADDFSSGFWCTAQQNGIFQTWAPCYTMFSRGNVSEKARLLTIRSLTEDHLKVEPFETSAVDLYAGIGYFSFSYAKAGVGKVLCWEINPWSVEGLRRGAHKNKWAVRTVKHDEAYDGPAGDHERFLIFEESNKHAASRINNVRRTIPPVMHVNCGFLPSSEDSWEVAVQVLDQNVGGWVHVHENIAKKDIETRKDDIVRIFTDLMEKHSGPRPGNRWQVHCEHLEQVKSYAPMVIHCVLDIAITPLDWLCKEYSNSQRGCR